MFYSLLAVPLRALRYCAAFAKQRSRDVLRSGGYRKNERRVFILHVCFPARLRSFAVWFGWRMYADFAAIKPLFRSTPFRSDIAVDTDPTRIHITMNDFSTTLDHIGATYLAGESTDVETLRRLQTQFADLAAQLDADTYGEASAQSRGVADDIETCLSEGAEKTQCFALWGRIEKSLDVLQSLITLAEKSAPVVATNEATSPLADFFTAAASDDEAGELDPDLLAGFISEAQEHLETAVLSEMPGIPKCRSI